MGIVKRRDRIYRLPRKWSNSELRKFACLFTGDVINVSAWQDEDKEGGLYRNYFTKAKSYTISNYLTEIRGFQGYENEILLNLEGDLPRELRGKFDVVFNHTTLEHIYNFQQAFHNLCLLCRDIVIVVVPFMQEMHAGAYGDYWRFSPQAVDKMFAREYFNLLYLSSNNHKNTSVYIFAIATRKLSKWNNRFNLNNLNLNPIIPIGSNIYNSKWILS
jgi:hypothetical protein